QLPPKPAGPDRDPPGPASAHRHDSDPPGHAPPHTPRGSGRQYRTCPFAPRCPYPGNPLPSSTGPQLGPALASGGGAGLTRATRHSTITEPTRTRTRPRCETTIPPAATAVTASLRPPRLPPASLPPRGRAA